MFRPLDPIYLLDIISGVMVKTLSANAFEALKNIHLLSTAAQGLDQTMPAQNIPQDI